MSGGEREVPDLLAALQRSIDAAKADRDPTAGERAACRYVMHAPGDTCDCKARLAQVVTHTRASTSAGPDYCAECSEAISEWVQWPCAPASPSAVAASTGTSEGEPNIVQRIVDAWDCCGTCAGGVLARYMADREAAARAKERERIAQAIEADADHRSRVGFVIAGAAMTRAARIAREQAR